MRSILSLLVLLAIVTATPAQEDGFKRERTPKNAAGKDALEGKNPPRLSVAKWLNSKERLSLKKLKGKVVVLDFWGTWWGPCRSAVPHLNELFKKYDRKDLVILGIHTTNGAEKMADYVKSSGILYPVAADREKRTVKAFRVDSFPDYYVIDRAGKLRFADLANAELDRAIATLVKEKAPVKLDARVVLKNARAKAKAENKNLLVHLGAPWWGYCGLLEEFLDSKQVAPLIAQDYIDVKIDTQEMTNGKKVAFELRKTESGGIPWMTIVTPDLVELVNADGPKGNVGCPVADHEIDWFMQMISKTAKNLDAEEQGTIKAALKRHAKKIRGE